MMSCEEDFILHLDEGQQQVQGSFTLNYIDESMITITEISKVITVSAASVTLPLKH